jgi:hypothetical protein
MDSPSNGGKIAVMPIIEFHGRPGAVDRFPKPHPARNSLPEWYKNLPSEVAGPTLTLKRCPPFLEAMASGYIIPMPSSVMFSA